MPLVTKLDAFLGLCGLTVVRTLENDSTPDNPKSAPSKHNTKATACCPQKENPHNGQCCANKYIQPKVIIINNGGGNFKYILFFYPKRI